jgi:hypothetical protein
LHLRNVVLLMNSLVMTGGCYAADEETAHPHYS